MSGPDYVRSYPSLGLADLPLVGGKNASLGELHRALAGADAAPDGFAVTAQAYRDMLERDGLEGRLRAVLEDLDVTDLAALARAGAAARALIYQASDRAELRVQISAAWRALVERCGPGVTVAVRSSATAEDLPDASFAGQHESYLNVAGEADLFEAFRRCLASLFTDRAIVYRHNNGFDHLKVYLSVGVMRMVRSDLSASGVIFTLDTETGFRDVVFVTGAYGLGENIVQGLVDPDEFYVHKPTFRAGHRAVLRRALGRKQSKLVYGPRGAGVRNRPTTRAERERFCITDEDVLRLADYALRIEDHYSKLAGEPRPMDIEWARDGLDGRLYVIQARPETVASRKAASGFERFHLTGSGPVLARGKAVGEKIAVGRARRVDGVAGLAAFEKGDVLIAASTSPDWEPVMKIAAAIVTEQGGRTCHAAIVARELGLPAVVGTGPVHIPDGTAITISCAEGETGRVYAGELAFETERVSADELTLPRTAILVNLGEPDLALRTALLPSAGVGLARMEFIIGNDIRIHPMAIACPERVTSARARRDIARAVRGYASAREFFVQRLSEGVGLIAAAFYPRPVIVRLSDFKTNEYARLLGGAGFEPEEENPMLGFRGAARYAHPAYAPGFALECAALKRVRDDMGLTNLKIMVPFCRRVDEARQVLAEMERLGLGRGTNGLEVYVMCEIPNNVIQIDAFSELFDGFSIGSNDLTQLTLGVDRDSGIVAFDFDERDPGMLEMLRLAVTGAHRNGRYVGICGEAPANYPEIAAFLTGLGIDSISVNPGSLARTIAAVRAAEAEAPAPA